MPDARDISDPARDDRGLLTALVGDGRPPLLFTGTALVLSGAFALFLSATRHFLPHDVRYLGMTAEQLCAMHQCKIVHFMFHDRVAFGGVLVAVGAIYMWLAEFPLRRGEPWAWWLLVVSGLVGFGSFLAYLGYGYLDTWHGVATLALLPVFVAGLSKSRQRLREPRGFRALLTPSLPLDWTTRFGFGRMCLIAVALGLIVGGLTITAVGITVVFVPQDLAYMGLSEADLRAVSPRLIPLIAHDRAGFGGGVCCAGLLVFFCTWCAPPSRGLWQVLCLGGAVGFACAIGVHPAIGYTSFVHLLPAYVGALAMGAGLVLTRRGMYDPRTIAPDPRVAPQLAAGA